VRTATSAPARNVAVDIECSIGPLDRTTELRPPT
jgi:hypothetical protein